MQKQLEAMTESYTAMNEKFLKMDMGIKEKNAEIDNYREVMDKQREEIDLLRKDEKKVFSNNMRASQMFYINTSKDKVPKCSEDCVIF